MLEVSLTHGDTGPEEFPCSLLAVCGNRRIVHQARAMPKDNQKVSLQESKCNMYNAPFPSVLVSVKVGSVKMSKWHSVKSDSGGTLSCSEPLDSMTLCVRYLCRARSCLATHVR